MPPLRFPLSGGCLVFPLLCLAKMACAQELSGQLRIQIDPQINRPPSERVVEDMERAFSDFLSRNTWTEEKFDTHERIVCNIVVTIKKNPNPNEYNAHAQLLSTRPVYNTDYQSVLMNYVDEGFDFNYTEGQPLQPVVNFFSSNLEAMLTFYAYVFIGMDFDSFSPLGGTPYFERARETANLAQQTNDKSWTSFGSTRNRHWLVENLLRKDFEPFRLAYYAYHREGMDILLDDPNTARKNILAQLQTVRQLSGRSRNAILLTVFLDTKYQEIIQIFSQGDRSLAQDAYGLMSEVDPGRIESYKNITKP